MREILFRGKQIDNGKWIYGLLCQYHEGGSAKIALNDFGAFDIGMAYCVDLSTIGQYTGLTDKNGVKIFEGDICDFTVFDRFDNDTQYRSVVVYAGSRFMLWKSVESEYYGKDGGFDLDWVVGQHDGFEVIGNIQETPELLEKKKALPMIDNGVSVNDDMFGGLCKNSDWCKQRYAHLQGRTTHYMKDGIGFPLNFCPECGKKLLEDCKTEEDCISAPHLIDATTSRDIASGLYPVYVLGFGVSEDDLTEDERLLLEQSKRWRKD